jgi:hypothetical protein
VNVWRQELGPASALTNQIIRRMKPASSSNPAKLPSRPNGKKPNRPIRPASGSTGLAAKAALELITNKTAAATGATASTFLFNLNSSSWMLRDHRDMIQWSAFHLKTDCDWPESCTRRWRGGFGDAHSLTMLAGLAAVSSLMEGGR